MPAHAATVTRAVDGGAGGAYADRIMLRELGDGLVMRRATEADAERLGQFNADVLRGQDAPDPAPWMDAWTRDLVGGRHPSFRADSALIAVGQPEIVGTRPELRGRGLVRAMFDVAHGWSAERGDQVLAINGIPWFYRQFGYEMA